MQYRPSHFEIHADDMERAATFYREVFGWEIKKWDGPIDYMMIVTGDKATPGINGGMVKRMGPRPEERAAVNGYVATMVVPDIDAILKTILEKGGTMALEKMEIPGVGWLAYCKDTEANIFGVMQDTSVKPA